MLKRNSITDGLIIGFLIPVLSFALLYGIFSGLEAIGSAKGEGKGLFSGDFMFRTAGIVAIGLNALPMNWAFKRRFTDTMRGIVVCTFVFVVIWLIYFGKSVL